MKIEEEGQMYRVNMWMMPSGTPHEARNFHCHPSFWDKMQQFGKEYGWQPMGTISEKDYRTDKEAATRRGDYKPGMYVTSEKIVEAKDARAWAEALERLLMDKPRIEAILKTNPVPLEGPGTHMDKAEYWDSMGRISDLYIERFASYMKQGPFGFAWDD